ncbi:MAG: hypothetical protein PVS3B1_00300 [Ktedonobacteraceae bacterium]
MWVHSEHALADALCDMAGQGLSFARGRREVTDNPRVHAALPGFLGISGPIRGSYLHYDGKITVSKIPFTILTS